MARRQDAIDRINQAGGQYLDLPGVTFGGMSRMTVAELEARALQFERAAELRRRANVIHDTHGTDAILAAGIFGCSEAWYTEYIRLVRQAQELWHS